MNIASKYPWSRCRNLFSDKIIKGATYYDGLPEGWKIAFGEQMIAELDRLLKKYKYTKKYRILQVKEKYGTLRWYKGGLPNGLYEEHEQWEDKYEKLSSEVCYYCGKPATHTTEGWILHVCDEHYRLIKGDKNE